MFRNIGRERSISQAFFPLGISEKDPKVLEMIQCARQVLIINQRLTPSTATKEDRTLKLFEIGTQKYDNHSEPVDSV